MVTTQFTVISEEFIIQREAKGLVSGKTYKTIADEAVNKYCVMVKHATGLVGVGLHINKFTAYELAKQDALEKQ